MKIDVYQKIKRPSVSSFIPIALEELANELHLRKGLTKKGISLLKDYNLISLTDVEEFERSFFRSIYANLNYFNFPEVNEEIKDIIYYTFKLSLHKNPELREAIEKAETERGLEGGAKQALIYYTYQKFYERMKCRTS